MFVYSDRIRDGPLETQRRCQRVGMVISHHAVLPLAGSHRQAVRWESLQRAAVGDDNDTRVSQWHHDWQSRYRDGH